MKLTLFGLPLIAIGVKGSLPSCCNSTVAEVISTNMTVAMAAIANIRDGTATSCSLGSFSCDDTDVQSMLSYFAASSTSFFNAVLEYTAFIGDVYGVPCTGDTPTCNCTSSSEILSVINATYVDQYLPAWNNFIAGNVANCTQAAIDLRATVEFLRCRAKQLGIDYDQCRYNCALACCDSEVAQNVTSQTALAQAAIDRVAAANAVACASGTVNCSVADIHEILGDLQTAENLFNQTLNDILQYYNITDYLSVPCNVDSLACNCTSNDQLLFRLGKQIPEFATIWGDFSSGTDRYCSLTLQLLPLSLSGFLCDIATLKGNYQVCASDCGTCADPTDLANIAGSMNQALSYIDNVWTVYYAQCPGRFNCSSTNLTLVQEDLTQAVAFYDLAIGNYTEIIQDTDFNSTCSLLNPSCSCRVISDQLITLNATYYLDYLPAWEDFIAGYTANCTAQAELLRNLVLQQKCIAEQLNVDYGKCYENCQTNWCLYYNCSNKPCGSAAVWTPPPRSRRMPWLRYSKAEDSQ